jgi:hypothetical protein
MFKIFGILSSFFLKHVHTISFSFCLLFLLLKLSVTFSCYTSRNHISVAINVVTFKWAYFPYS